MCRSVHCPQLITLSGKKQGDVLLHNIWYLPFRFPRFSNNWLTCRTIAWAGKLIFPIVSSEVHHHLIAVNYDAATVTILNVYIILICVFYLHNVFFFFNSAQLFWPQCFFFSPTFFFPPQLFFMNIMFFFFPIFPTFFLKHVFFFHPNFFFLNIVFFPNDPWLLLCNENNVVVFWLNSVLTWVWGVNGSWIVHSSLS